MRQLGPPVGGHKGIIGDDVGVKGAAPFARDEGADIAHADDANGLLPRLVAEEIRTFDFGAGTDLTIEFAHPPDHAERQCPRPFAAARSILSRPTPCLEMTRSFLARAMSSAPIRLTRTITPSASSCQFPALGSSQRMTSARCAAYSTPSGKNESST